MNRKDPKGNKRAHRSMRPFLSPHKAIFSTLELSPELEPPKRKGRQMGLQMQEPKPYFDDIAHRVIGVAIEVHRTLGPGFLESVYQTALAVEFDIRDIAYIPQAPVSVIYKGTHVGEGRLDFLVKDCLVVELKAVEAFAPIHRAQVISYLRATHCTLGLLLNFNVTSMKYGVKRVILSH
jgi:GxxExxY protein